jgi:putative glycosyltransferase
MKLSIVTTMYNSQATIEEFIRRCTVAASAITDDFEIVIVDDGSPDNALAIAIKLAEADPRLKVIELSRNFGHHKALMTGLRHAVGEYCFLIDSDLEEPPETLATFWHQLHREDLDVVYGYQEKRRGMLLQRLSGAIAYTVFNLLIPAGIPTNHLTVRLMCRAYVDALLLHRESQVIIGGLWVVTGFRQAGVAVDKKDKGVTTYAFRRRWTMFLDSVTNFSEAPLIGIFYLGVAIAFVSSLVGFWLMLRWLVLGVGVAGWLSVMLSVWILGGTAIFCIGVIGIYLGKVFMETKQRPYTIVRRVHQAGKTGGSSS